MKKQFKTFLLIFFISISLSLFAGLSYKVFSSPVNTNNYYKVIQVNRGDSLWSIAAEYKDNDSNTLIYIKEIKKANNLKTNTIRSGESLIIPICKTSLR